MTVHSIQDSNSGSDIAGRTRRAGSDSCANSGNTGSGNPCPFSTGAAGKSARGTTGNSNHTGTSDNYAGSSQTRCHSNSRCTFARGDSAAVRAK